MHYIASPFWGGGEQYVYDLSVTLQADHAVRSVFVCQPGTSEEVLARWRAIGHVYCMHPKTKNGKFSYIEALRLARIMRREEVDVLHMHDMKDYFLCAYAKLFCLRRIRLVATRHLIAPAKNKASWRWVYRRIDHMLFVSQRAADAFMVQPAVRRSFRHAVVVPNSIRLTDIPSDHPPLRTQYAIYPTLPLVLYHGRICREKGIVQLLQALAPTFKGQYAFILAGSVDDDVREELDALMQQPSIAPYIHLLGFRRDVASLIKQCQWGVLPSIVPEAASLSLLEHMSMGSAVIASDNGSQPEYAVNGKEAILLPPGQWEAWKEALESWAKEPQRAEQIGAEAKKRFLRDFTYTHFTETIYAIYMH